MNKGENNHLQSICIQTLSEFSSSITIGFLVDLDVYLAGAFETGASLLS
jgi:hypothetical protein